MHFGNPQILWLLATGWPLLAMVGWRTTLWRRRIAGRIGQPHLLDRLHPETVTRWRGRRLALSLLALFLLIIAASRPQYGEVEQSLRGAGSNVLIALDCSASMNARDVQPSRMESARQSLGSLLRQLRGNRVGIVAFAGTAFLQCPMTLDSAMAQLVLESLDTQSIGVPGTDFGQAIGVAVEAFNRGGDDGARTLVLLTDGEDNEGQGLDAARKASAEGVVIYAIGIGTERGAPLLEESGGFKEDKSGRKVNTQLRMDLLRQMAEETGGQAFEAGDSPLAAIDQIARLIRRQEKVQFEARRQIIYQDRFQWFLAPALLILLWLLVSRPEPTRVGETA